MTVLIAIESLKSYVSPKPIKRLTKLSKKPEDIVQVEAKEVEIVKIQPLEPVQVQPIQVEPIQESKKYMMCFTFFAKKPCISASCLFAHTIEELVHNQCKFGTKCPMVAPVKEGVYRNVQRNDNKKCIRFHGSETVDSFLFRIRPQRTVPETIAPEIKAVQPKNQVQSVQPKNQVQKPFNLEASKFTMLCKSVFDDSVCKYGSKCHYAHHVLDMNMRQCVYGSSCRFALYHDDGVYCNTGDSKPCFGWHPQETPESYGFRMNINRKYYTRAKSAVKTKSKPCVSKPTNMWHSLEL